MTHTPKLHPVGAGAFDGSQPLTPGRTAFKDVVANLATTSGPKMSAGSRHWDVSRRGM
jgi:hypothetical protein